MIKSNVSKIKLYKKGRIKTSIPEDELKLKIPPLRKEGMIAKRERGRKRE